MLVVTFLATVTTGSIWVLPWIMQRRADTFSWRTALLGQVASLWWAAASIAAFGGVMIGGHAFGVPGAAISGLLVDGVFAWTFHQSFGSTRKLQALCEALATKPAATSVATLAALEAELARHRERSEERTNGYDAWAGWTLHAGARASLAGHTADALRWTESIDPMRLRRNLRGTYTQHVASFRIATGDRAGARTLIASTSRPVEPVVMEEALQGLEALLEALEGDAIAALARADAALAVPAKKGPVEAIWLATRAHALEASGAPGEARAALYAMRAEYGDDYLRRMVGHGGPASAAAAAVLASRAPYR
jgi:hypothetical protein